jgi:hypothetical protein
MAEKATITLTSYLLNSMLIEFRRHPTITSRIYGPITTMVTVSAAAMVLGAGYAKRTDP